MRLQTTELPLAAYLVTKGHKPADFIIVGKQITFEFEKDDTIDKDVTGYVGSEISLYEANRKSLQKIIYTKQSQLGSTVTRFESRKGG